jgi:hypothetical protein
VESPGASGNFDRAPNPGPFPEIGGKGEQAARVRVRGFAAWCRITLGDLARATLKPCASFAKRALDPAEQRVAVGASESSASLTPS